MSNLIKLKQEYLKRQLPLQFEENLRKVVYGRRTSFKKSKIAAGISITLILGLNALPALAQNLREIPALRPIVDVLTLNRFVAESADGQITLDISVPTLEGAGEIGEVLNQKYLSIAEEEYHRFIQNLPEADSDISWHEAVIGDYEILWQDDEIVVIKNWMAYLAGSGYQVVNYDVVDIKNQLILNLPALFKDDSYIRIISNEVIRQMREQMKDPNGNLYWIDPEDSPGGEVFSEIADNQSFYINSERQLVITFGEYEVAPGFVGTPEFVINYQLIKHLLVSDRYLK